MRIALDISSTKSDHRFRGIGNYTQNLLKQLVRIADNDHSLEFVSFDKQIPNADLFHFPAFNPFFLSFPTNLINKSIITIHDLIPIDFPKHYPAGVMGYLRWHFQRALLKNCRAIITDSISSSESILKHIKIPEDKVHAIYLAADKKYTKQDQRSSEHQNTLKRLGITSKYILYVGDMNWNKNIMMLAKSCVELKTPLVVVGKQAINFSIDRKHPWNKELVEFQDYAKDHKNLIICCGFLNTDELVHLYNQAMCYVQPSIAEGFGLPVIEAMKCGCLVLCSNTTSLPEIAEEAAIYFDPFDRSDLIKKLTRIVKSDQDFEILAKKEKGIIQSAKFSWEDTAQKTWQVYKKTLNI